MRELLFASSFDDGLADDIVMAHMLEKYQLPSVFYIPTRCDLAPVQIESLAKRFEIGGHTVSHHQDLKKLTGKHLFDEINNNRLWLQHVANQPVNRFAYPRGRHNESVRTMVAASGFLEARTTLVLLKDSDPRFSDPFQQPTSVQVNQRTEYKTDDWVIVAKREAQRCATAGKLFHVWGHSTEIIFHDNWGPLENFFEWLTKEYKIINGYAATPAGYHLTK